MITDEIKLKKLKELEDIIKGKEHEKDTIKPFILGVLHVIEECNESWCDSCGIVKATGKLCCDYLDVI